MDYNLNLDFTEEELREGTAAVSEPSGFDGHFDNNLQDDLTNSETEEKGYTEADKELNVENGNGSNNGSDSVEHIVVDAGYEDVVGGPYTSEEYRRNMKIQKEIPKDILYGTGDVAKMLGVTEQTVRNYCNLYAEFIGIAPMDSSTNNRNRWKLTKTQVEQLRSIIQIKDQNNFTSEQMLSYLSDPGQGLSVPTDQTIERAFNLLRTDMQDIVKQAVNEMQGGLTEQMALSNAKYSEELAKVIEFQESIIKELQKNAAMSDEIKELSDIVKKKNESEDMAMQYSKLESENKELSNRLDAQSLEILKLEEKVLKKEEELKKLSEASKQRKKFLGIF